MTTTTDTTETFVSLAYDAGPDDLVKYEAPSGRCFYALRRADCVVLEVRGADGRARSEKAVSWDCLEAAIDPKGVLREELNELNRLLTEWEGGAAA